MQDESFCDGFSFKTRPTVTMTQARIDDKLYIFFYIHRHHQLQGLLPEARQ
jgi:hypothetical protein